MKTLPWLLLDITIGMRTRAFAVALGAHAALLGAFVVLWSGGVPLLPGTNLYEQLRLIDGLFLLAVLPWVASRCGGDERGNQLVMLSALAATPPSCILLARFAGRAIVGLVVALAGLPLMVVAQQISAVPAPRVLFDTVPLVALAVLASAASLFWSVQSRSVILAWTAATASTVFVVFITTSALPGNAALGALVVLAALAAGSSAARANTSLRYLSEQER